jgi:hypothetical protein
VLESSIQALRDGCGDVRRRLETTEARTAQFVARAEELRQQRGKVETRSVAAASFLSAYQLTPSELTALYTTPLETDEGKAFFAALRRIDDIRRECKGLISSALQSLGIEILEDMAKHQVRLSVVFALIPCSVFALAWLRGQHGFVVLYREQEAVYERLLQWVQVQCQSLSKDANDIESTEHEIQPLLRAALRVLLGRPSYYRLAVVSCLPLVV